MANATSVFQQGYLLDPKLEDTGNARMAFLAVSNDSADAIKALGFSDAIANDIATNGFWHIVVHSVSETHIDAFSLANTLSDTVTIFSTGAVPVGISITGMLLTTPDKDDRLNFLRLYADKIRGTQVAMAKAILCFGFKDTLMRLYIQSITLATNTNSDTFTQISLTGVASHYTTVSYTQTSDGYESTEPVAKTSTTKGVELVKEYVPLMGF